MEIEPTNSHLDNKEVDEKQLKYISQILGIKFNKEDFNLFKDMDDLSQFINSIKFNDKKKNEIKDKISDEIKSLKNRESYLKLSEDKNKKFSDIVKIKGKTIVYHTAENDELSQTMHAFYFCDKSMQVLSDKQAAEYRAMHTEYDIPLNFGFGAIKEEDNLSSYSNNIKVSSVQKEPENKIKLNKKRNKSKSNKKQITEKADVTEESRAKNGNGNAIDKQEAERDYCFSNCRFGRKSRGQSMIECDNCNEWYHSKCLNFTNEQIQKYKDKEWYCPYCNKMDIDDKN